MTFYSRSFPFNPTERAQRGMPRPHDDRGGSPAVDGDERRLHPRPQGKFVRRSSDLRAIDRSLKHRSLLGPKKITARRFTAEPYSILIFNSMRGAHWGLDQMGLFKVTVHKLSR